jgi:hypothetical protein
MYLFEVGLAVAVVLGLVLSITAYFLLARALWPRLSAAAEARFARAPILSIVTGLPLALLVLIVAGKLIGSSAGIVGWPLAAIAIGAALAGGSGVAARVGKALASPADLGREWAPVLRGGLVILLASLLPILGWFVILPALLAGGLGAAVLGVLRPIRAAEAAPASPAEIAAR